jgi:DNA-binding SARP family transcriptional activator
MEARDGHGPVDLGGGKAATLLAILLSQEGAVVTAAELIDQLWAGTPPPTAESALRVHLSRLRSRLGPADGPLLRRRAGGYQLSVDRACVDAHTFEDLVGAGLGALRGGDDAGAWEALTAAVALWHGRPYDGIDSPALIPHTMRLEKLRLDAAEALASLRLERGEHGHVVTELAELVAAHPERERMASHLILALYRSGRQAESLAEFQRVRRWLDEELGLLPSAELTALENLRGDLSDRLAGAAGRGGAEDGGRLDAPAGPHTGEPGNRIRAGASTLPDRFERLDHEIPQPRGSEPSGSSGEPAQ